MWATMAPSAVASPSTRPETATPGWLGPHAIEDPWGLDDSVFRSVFTRIQLANERVSEFLRSRVE